MTAVVPRPGITRLLRLRRPWRLAAEATALVVAAVVAFPLYWMVLSAFKPAGEVRSTEPRPWTLEPSLDAFRRVLGQEDFGRYFLNSLLVAGVVVVASALIAFLAATAVTRFRFRFRTTLLIMFLVAQMVPVEALTIPLFFLMRDAGQTLPAIGLNTLGSLILPHLAFSLPFAIWMLRGFVKAVPEALEEAALIDGASRTRFLWQILFPLVFPGLVATSVFSFISTLRKVVHHQRDRELDSADGSSRVLQTRGERLGRHHGGVDRDDHPGVGLLRTRTAPTGLGPGRRGEGLISHAGHHAWYAE